MTSIVGIDAASRRYQPDKTMFFLMCGCLPLHIGAVLYTAFYSSRRVWAIVAGPGFYLLVIPVMIGLLVMKRAGARG